MSVFGDNVAKLRSKRDISQRDLAEALKISKGTVGAWETKGSTPNMETMEALAAYFGVTVGQLFTPGIAAVVDDAEIGVYGHIAAGVPIEKTPCDFTFPCPSKLIKRYPHAFYLKVDGDSMSRVLPDGCYALVDPDQNEPHDNAPYAVCVNGYSATIKRIRMLANGLELIPDSMDPTYRSKIYDNGDESTESITVIGRVVWYTVPLDFDL